MRHRETASCLDEKGIRPDDQRLPHHVGFALAAGEVTIGPIVVAYDVFVGRYIPDRATREIFYGKDKRETTLNGITRGGLWAARLANKMFGEL